MIENLQVIRLSAKHCEAYRFNRKESLKNHPTAFGSSYEDVKDEPTLGFEEYLVTHSDKAFSFGAFVNDKLIGICSYAGNSSFKEQHRGYIIQMYVKPEYNGMGVGHELLKNVVHQAWLNPKLEQLELDVNTENKAAIKLYEKVGFKKIAVFPNLLKYNNNYYDFLFMILEKGNEGI